MPRNPIKKAAFIDTIQKELGDIDEILIKRKDATLALFQRLQEFKNDEDTPQNYKNVIQTSIDDGVNSFQIMLDSIV